MQNTTLSYAANNATTAVHTAHVELIQPSSFNEFFELDNVQQGEEYLAALQHDFAQVENMSGKLIEHIFTTALAVSGYSPKAKKSNMTKDMWKKCRQLIMVAVGVQDATGKRLIPHNQKKKEESYFSNFQRSVEAGKPEYLFVHGVRKLLKEFSAGSGKKGATTEATEGATTEASLETLVSQLRKELAAAKVSLAVVTQERDNLKVKCEALEAAANKQATIAAKRASKSQHASA